MVKWWHVPLAFVLTVMLGVLLSLSLAYANCQLQMPPSQYDTGRVSVREYSVPLSQLAQICPVHGATTIGCAFEISPQDRWKIKARWMVWIPQMPVYDCSLASIKQHEYAHVRGWTHH